MIAARVIYDRHPQYVLAPLGYWRLHERLHLPNGREVIVASLDPDGAAVAWDFDTLDRQCFERDIPMAERLAELAHITTSYSLSWANERQRRQVAGIVAAGQMLREAHERDAA